MPRGSRNCCLADKILAAARGSDSYLSVIRFQFLRVQMFALGTSTIGRKLAKEREGGV